MSRASANALMEAAAKALAWELYAAAGYGRTRAYVNVEKFDCAMRTAAREWREARSNLQKQRRKYGNTEK